MLTTSPLPVRTAIDAGKMLGLGRPVRKELPTPPDGYMAIHIPRATSFQSVRTSPVGLEKMKSQEWYTNKPWYTAPIREGIWLFRFLPDSHGKTTKEQRKLMTGKEDFAHITLATALLLCLQLSDFGNPLDGSFLSVHPPAETSDYVLQIGCPTSRLEVISHLDRADSLSIAAAAMLMK